VSTTAIQTLVFRDEPALKTVPAEPGELPDEVADRDISYQCGMRHDGQPTHGFVGWVERDHADTYGRDLIDLEWVSFYEVQMPSDTEPTRFCEDCLGWLDQLAPHLLAASAAVIARHKLVAELPESYTADEVSAMSDNEAISAAVSCGLLEG
jgi:hypothetical protein